MYLLFITMLWLRSSRAVFLIHEGLFYRRLVGPANRTFPRPGGARLLQFAQQSLQQPYDHRSIRKLSMTVDKATNFADDERQDYSMENKLFHEWSLKDDQLLWDHRDDSIASLASRFGRGLRGVEQRLTKLKDLNSPAYQRLFVSKADDQYHSATAATTTTTKTKLVPASEVIRRIQWDFSLSPSDFFILHYDRVEDSIIETVMDAPNNSIAGKATSFVDALPEHRIVAIKYKERIVWDRRDRIDLVFENEGIESVITCYDTWKRQQEEIMAQDQQRRTAVTNHLQQILGVERFALLKELLDNLRSRITDDSTLSKKLEVERCVEEALSFFREVRDDPTQNINPHSIPRSDYEAINTISELIAILPNDHIQALIFDELVIYLQRLEGKKIEDSSIFRRPLPELHEKDLKETYVRGTGPGGQKINKTSNRVVLLHIPTQLRVECQDTRSLHDNRRIARKRLQQKLDEYIHGNQSKASVKAQKVATKKAKAKARSRKRQLQKHLEKGSSPIEDIER